MEGGKQQQGASLVLGEHRKAGESWCLFISSPISLFPAQPRIDPVRGRPFVDQDTSDNLTLRNSTQSQCRQDGSRSRTCTSTVLYSSSFTPFFSSHCCFVAQGHLHNVPRIRLVRVTLWLCEWVGRVVFAFACLNAACQPVISSPCLSPRPFVRRLVNL